MRGFEDGVAGHVVDVRAGGDADPADLRGQRVADVVAVQVQSSDHVVVGGAQQDLLEEVVGDDVLDDDAVRELAPGATVDLDGAEFTLGELVAPVAEAAFRELHDVALVDDGDALAAVVDGELDGGAHEALGAFLADGLDAEGAGVGEADLGDAHLAHQEAADLVGLGRAGLVLDAGVDVLGVLAEDDHVHVFGALDGAGHALEVLDGAHAGVQVEFLAQRDVDGADAGADRGGQRALDAEQVLAEGVQGALGQPLVGAVHLQALLTGVDFHPLDLLLAAVGDLDGGVEDADAGFPDVGAGAVALDEGNDGVVRHGELAVLHRDLLALRGHLDVVIHDGDHCTPVG